MNVFSICLACIFALPGLLLSLFNWYSISVWVWRKYRNPGYRKDPGIVLGRGGFLLFASLIPLMHSVPGMRHIWLLLVPFIVDYGCLPMFVLSPLLYSYLDSRKSQVKGKTPETPSCKEVQLDFPVLLVGEDELPDLACSPEDLSGKMAEQGAVLYADSLCQHVLDVTPQKKPGFWKRFWSGSTVPFGAAEVEYTTPRPYKLGKLLKLQDRLLREDDDAWTQYHEATELRPLLKECADFREFIVLGCMAGWWEPSAGSGLPGLFDSDLSMESIRTECSRSHSS